MPIEILIFVLGLAFGSFFNVCISRLPKGESVVWPGSRCPSCKKGIAWYDNIPLLSFLLLKGRCRHCGFRIPVRYFLVEITTGLLFWSLWKCLGPGWRLAEAVVFLSLLEMIFVTDLETGLIPDPLTVPGIAAGLLFGALASEGLGQGPWTDGLIHALMGGAAGAAILWLTGWAGKIIFRKEAMGGGDVMLLAMAGTFVGALNTVFIFFTAPFFALPVAIYAKWIAKTETIPYGPYLALSSVLFFFWGEPIRSYFLITY
ncbi:MAG: prepilin peptidase [Candidatus Omnitrophota bacterium]